MFPILDTNLCFMVGCGRKSGHFLQYRFVCDSTEKQSPHNHMFWAISSTLGIEDRKLHLKNDLT